MGKLNSRFDRMEDKINELKKRKEKNLKKITPTAAERDRKMENMKEKLRDMMTSMSRTNSHQIGVL